MLSDHSSAQTLSAAVKGENFLLTMFAFFTVLTFAAIGAKAVLRGTAGSQAQIRQRLQSVRGDAIALDAQHLQVKANTGQFHLRVAPLEPQISTPEYIFVQYSVC